MRYTYKVRELIQGLEDFTEVGEATQNFADPEIANVYQRLNQVEQYLNKSETTRHQAVVNQSNEEVATFAGETGDDGQPLRPHFEAVRSNMAALFQSGAAKDLQHAYEMAVWSNPDTRKLMMEQRDAQQEAERIAAAKEAAKKANRAKGTQVRKRDSGEPVAAQGSIEDTMSAVYDRIMGAG